MERIRIESENATLAACYTPGRLSSGVVLAHPHPLYGGTMENNVVLAAEAAFQAAGWHTLRFDFRGAGESTGTHSEGPGEIQDLKAACMALEERVSEVSVCGYSFGAWVATSAVSRGLYCERLFLVAPPLDFLPFPDPLTLSPLRQVIFATDDMFCRLDHGTDSASRWNPFATVDVIPGADHFFSGFEENLTSLLLTTIS